MEATGLLDRILFGVNKINKINEEIQYCDEHDADARSSLETAIKSFDDAFRCLATVEDRAAYRAAETTYLNDSKHRYKEMPRDAVHLACAAHQTRMRNSLRTTGVTMIEKAVLKQRIANMKTIQNVYFEKQRKALG